MKYNLFCIFMLLINYQINIVESNLKLNETYFNSNMQFNKSSHETEKSILNYHSISQLSSQENDPNDTEILLIISKQGLNNLKNGFIHYIISKFSNFKLKSLDIAKRIDFIGNIRLVLSEIYLSIGDMYENQIDIEFNDSNRLIELQILKTSGVISFDYSFYSNFYNVTSTGNLYITDLGLSLKIKPYEFIKEINGNSYNFPSFNITELFLNDNFSTKLVLSSDGKTEILLKQVFNQLGHLIVKIVDEAYHKQILNILNKTIFDFFQKQTGIIQIPKTDVSVMYSMKEDFYLKNDLIKINLEAQILYRNQTSHIVPVEIPEDLVSNGISLIINQNILNEFLYAFNLQGLLHIEIKYVDLFNTTTNFSILNTTTFIDLIEGMQKRYSKDIPMSLNITTDFSITPEIKLIPQYSSINLKASIAFIVEKSEKNKEQAFKIISLVNADVYLTIQKGLVKGKLKSLKLDKLSLAESLIELDIKSLDFIINAILPSIEIILNAKLEKGVKIPNILNLSFEDTTLTIYNGYLILNFIPKFLD